jgi:hypothetical protein
VRLVLWYQGSTSFTDITATPVLNLDDRGRPLSFPRVLTGPDGAAWLLAAGADLRMLFIESGCLVPTLSPSSTPTYFKNVVKEKFIGDTVDIKRRVRGTAGGDRVTVPYCCSTATASMLLVKKILNAVASEHSFFGMLNVANFYYGADIPEAHCPSLRIPLQHYPSDLLYELGLTDFVRTDRAGNPYVYADVKKCIPGLPQSGLLSQLRLISHLESHGYFETDTPMLFRHVSRPISFTLVVDDFGVKYSDITDYNHLRRILELQYEVTGSSTGTKYLGFTVDHNRTDRTITLSLPGYIAKLLQAVCPDGVKPARSPFIYEPVVYG